MDLSTVNLTPNPKILATIAQNPMKPIDALSELIDNSLDGFAAAAERGEPIENPTVTIDIPSGPELNNGFGVLRVSDNGTGLSRENAISAVTAGFSGQDNPIDRLGLFGMGFNISTAKLGQQTRFITYQRSQRNAHAITINIPEMAKNRNFEAPVEELEFEDHKGGTTIEISSWWPHGHQNDGFIQALARFSKPKLREQLGRRYSGLIEKGYTIIVNKEPCPVFRHCVWTEQRYVEHREFGKIPARIYTDEQLGQEFRCANCWTQLDTASVQACPTCHEESSPRVINKRIKGWVGIQRFDDASFYGIDLVRNGRVIRDSEKEAFFTFRNDDGEEIKDYPIDSQYGRIIGVIELNHVPVNYLKTDFDRTTTYWTEAIEYLRGTTSLQPKRADVTNDSPIYKLFQGYRKVREAGTKDLYMGFFNTQKNRSERISRDVEKEYYEKFKNNEPGYGFDDDTEWYNRVLDATKKPPLSLKECPEGHENVDDAELCAICGYIFNKKTCINEDCKHDIPQSAFTCPDCGEEQMEGTEDFWECALCRSHNSPSIRNCTSCGATFGAVDPFSLDQLISNSFKSEELSLNHQAIKLPDDIQTDLTVNIYLMQQDTTLTKHGDRLPLYLQHNQNTINMFIDQNHPAYTQYGDRNEDYIAIELANYLTKEYNSRISNSARSSWSASDIYYYIHDQIWKERTKVDHGQIVTEIGRFFGDILERAGFLLSDIKEEIYNDLDERELQEIYSNALQSGMDTDGIAGSGKFLRFIPESTIVKLVKKYPEHFFDGRFWNEKYATMGSDLSEDTKLDLQAMILDGYISSLEDIQRYKRLKIAPANPDITNRAFYSLSILTRNQN